MAKDGSIYKVFARTMYFLLKMLCLYCTNLFFRQIEIIGKKNIPNDGPVIVYGNHNNQFVDGMVRWFLTTASSGQDKEEN